MLRVEIERLPTLGLDLRNRVGPFSRRCQVGAAVFVDRIVALLTEDRVVRSAASRNVCSVSTKDRVSGTVAINDVIAVLPENQVSTIPFFTVHDEFRTLRRHVQRVQEVIQEEMSRIGCHR
jgi:hypothetical protein